jgi:RNA polymerase sigma-70 factor (sigma-E family)
VADEEFRAFVEARYAHLLRMAYLLAGSREQAEDMLQSALLATMLRWRHVEQPEAYVRRVMINQLVSRWRRQRIVEVLTSMLPERPAPSEEVELRDELWSALRKLPAGMRTVLVLRYWEDLSEAGTADLLGCSVGSVKSQASRGLARLRELMNVPARATVGALRAGEAS